MARAFAARSRRAAGSQDACERAITRRRRVSAPAVSASRVQPAAAAAEGDVAPSLADAWRMWPTNAGARCAVVALVGLFLVVTAQQLGQSYVIDEAEFPFIAKATSQSGLPIYYHGELRPVDVGIFHPPLYVYMLAGWIQVFGSSHEAVRAFGVACALLTAVTGAATVNLLVPRRRNITTPLFLGLFLLNPLTVSSALLPDIDGTVGVLAVTLGVHAIVVIVTGAGDRRWHVALAGATLGFALSTKLTTPLALIPLLGVAFLLSGRSLRRAIAEFAGAVVLGVALFLAWWGPLAAATSLDFAYPFRFTYDSLVGKSTATSLLDRFAAMRPARITLYWLDPLLLGLTCTAGVFAAWRWRDARARAVVLVVVFALGTVALYDVITTPVFRFPKYWIAAVPAATVSVVWLVTSVAGSGSRMNWRGKWAPGMFVAAIIGAAALTQVAFTRNSEVAGLAPLQPLRSPLATVVSVAVLAVLLLFVVSADSPRGRRVASAVVGSCVLTVGVHGIAQTLATRSADYSTRYYFGERGFDQAVADVRALTPDGEAVLAPKDIGFEAQRPFYEDALLFGDPATLQKLLSDGTTPVAVTRKDFDYSEPIYPDAFRVIRQYMTPVFDRPGSGFVIWKLRQRSRA
jgi:hypothetical protein